MAPSSSSLSPDGAAPLTAYYNENDEFAAAWLRELIRAGHIAPGHVDTRSIEDVRPDDLRGFTQHHFFAGIGIWSHALRAAGWPDDRPVWTGSCPCQPFSAAGKRGGAADKRHLWPAWGALILECRPPVVIGEQVEGAVRLGWLDLVFGDLEDQGYACGAVVFGAHSVGAPHIRQRLYWLADANPPGLGVIGGGGLLDGERPALGDDVDGRGADVWSSATAGFWRDPDWLACRDGRWRPVEARVQQMVDGVAIRMGPLRADLQRQTEEILNEAATRLQTEAGEIVRAVRDAVGSEAIFGARGGVLGVHEAQILLSYLLEYAGPEGRESDAANGSGARGHQRDLRVLWRERAAGDPSYQRELARRPLGELTDALRLLSHAVARSAQEAGHPVLYADAPASFPLGDYVPEDQVGQLRPKNRVGRLRGYGNGLVAPQAAAFVRAYLTRP